MLPTLEYYYAFDICGIAMQARPTLLITSNRFYAHELEARGDTLPANSEHCSLAIWAEPTRTNAEYVCADLKTRMAADGDLIVIASGQLARFLPEREVHSLGGQQVLAMLRRHGFHISGVEGYHGPASIAWSYAYRLMKLISREDLAARCLTQLRAVYVTPHIFWTTLMLIQARKAVQ